MPLNGTSNGGASDSPAFFVGIVFAVAIIVITGIFILTDIKHTSPNTDPRKGEVYLQSGSKFCDGTTLIYNGSGTSAISNSPECQK